METIDSTPQRLTWSRFLDLVRALAVPELKGRPLAMLGVLFTILLGISALNVLNSFVGRNFMTAIEARSMADFLAEAGLYIGVFAASTIVSVLARFTEERLGLLWRERLSHRLAGAYLGNRTYYAMKVRGQVPNPDERIADDVRSFTGTTLSFAIMLINSTLTVIAFSGVLLSISAPLFLVAVIYALGGTAFSILLGRPLVPLNSAQLDREANFRSDLIHVREHAESIALSRREGRILQRLNRRIDSLAENLRQIIRVNRDLGYFSTGYNYLIQVIPALLVAPLFIRGEAEFGVITQSSIAFAHLVGAFSLIVTQFQSIASFTAVVSRLDALWQDVAKPGPEPESNIRLEARESPDDISYQDVSLTAMDTGRPLIRNLTLTIPYGTRVLIRSPNKAANAALFRATAGIWPAGSGRIVRPSFDYVRFLPERPYLYPGTLRELLLKTGEEQRVPDEAIIATLRRFELDTVLSKAKGLDVEQDWVSLLSVGEEQLLAFTRLLLAAPRFAFLDRVCTALTPEQIDRIWSTLTEHRITYLALGDPEDSTAHFDAVLDIDAQGGWTYRRLTGSICANLAETTPPIG